ncbi:MAG: phosphatidylserine/phosphatidylglycerophosphate/cardiolipin synthase family protein, partial [Cyanobacteria bacterium P01_H01_bin.130]
QDYQKLGDRDGVEIVSPEEADRMDTMRMLARGQVPILDDRADGSKGSGLMHHKFVIVDGQRVLTGSANFTPSDTFGDVGRPHTLGNPNHLLVISSSTVAGWFQEEFELMWGDGPGGEPDSQFGRQKPFRPPRTIRLGNSQLTVHFAPAPQAIALPETTTGTIATALATVQKQADLALFVFSEQYLADRLLSARQRGVQIRLLIDTGFAFRHYSEGLDLAGVVRLNPECEVEAGNRVWGATPIPDFGFPQLPPQDLLHHKFAVLDRRMVIAGSHNWSRTAARDNDETLIVVENVAIAAHFQREFDRLISTAMLGIPRNVQAKIDRLRQDCRSRQTSTLP